MRTSVNITKLVTDARNGDKEAFGTLYDTYLDAVYRFVFFRIGIKEEAEDITETTFVSVFTHIDTYKEHGLPFEAWLFRIARNKIIDYYRKKKQTVTLDAVVGLEDTKQGPEKKTEIALTKEMVMKKLRELPDTYQEIIILKYIEERDNEEISTILDKPVDQVRVLQSRALARLRTLLQL